MKYTSLGVFYVLYVIFLIQMSPFLIDARGIHDHDKHQKHPNVHLKLNNKPVNVIIILADDMGYGDSSVYPFMGSGIYTPQLEKMASRGTIMTNFHSAAPVCTPTRVSILTGMFPWRLGVKGVYEYGDKKHNRDDWLAQVPTIAMAFRDAGYITGHSGKWHAGGMRNDDWEMRLQPDYGNESIPGSRRCPHPGPNQQGFNDYVSVLDGPGSQRQGLYQVNSVLYSRGCEILLRNDTLIGKSGGDNKKEYLFDCEVRHAIRIMKHSLSVKKPFFINLWFHGETFISYIYTDTV
jgi:arylsulfatase A